MTRLVGVLLLAFTWCVVCGCFGVAHNVAMAVNEVFIAGLWMGSARAFRRV